MIGCPVRARASRGHGSTYQSTGVSGGQVDRWSTCDGSIEQGVLDRLVSNLHHRRHKSTSWPRGIAHSIPPYIDLTLQAPQSPWSSRLFRKNFAPCVRRIIQLWLGLGIE
ncbi:hypothetical protein VFPPC_17486 [Pochonia chlamydosporia 170]|uniref:Uncharacterized protein n=1 Tax=Pochonia chlamydosporia 170 TaxID=1380566 RepID=A0A219ARG6_METCM|nr:hypothetical protein VFPPC_17486 [Pochonia chlamydosporia 170]OWT43351.1 hypothetical protein VFPPC_17486 [Pochonia chlamydosporia 170]